MKKLPYKPDVAARMILGDRAYAEEITPRGWKEIIFRLIGLLVNLSKDFLKDSVCEHDLFGAVFNCQPREKVFRETEADLLKNLLDRKKYSPGLNEKNYSSEVCWGVLGRVPCKIKRKFIGETCIALNENGLIAVFLLEITAVETPKDSLCQRKERVVSCAIYDSGMKGFQEYFENLLQRNPKLGPEIVRNGLDGAYLKIMQEEEVRRKRVDEYLKIRRSIYF